MTKSQRQQYGLGSFVKKFTRPIKKVLKSPLTKAALLGGLGWAANAGKLGGLGSGWLSKIAPAAGNLWSKYRGLSGGKQALLGLGAAGVMTPYIQKMMGTGPYVEEEIDDSDWTLPSSSIANLLTRTKDYYRDYDPYLSDLSFQPAKQFVDPTFYSAKGGLAKLANGGGVAEAQAEQMLKMQYQKYRNQGGTMSYQQFKMTVLKQAQGQGPMAQGQQAPQMAAHGGRMGYQGGELVTDESMVEATPAGMMEENVEEVQGEPTREQMEALALEIFQLRLEELDQEQLMVVYQAAMEQQPKEEMMQEEIEFNPQMAADGGRMGYASGTAYPNPNAVVPKGDLATNMLNVFANKFAGRKIATPGRPVATSNSFMGNMIPSTFKSQDADYQAYLASGSELPYQAWKASRQTVADGGRIGLANGGVIGSHVPGYTTPPGYNQFDYPTGGVRVGRAEGGLMSLGGMEKDYRAEGGFVPLGKEERADDVPARLSKNEFVFTADAVRNAGGGDIDAGAEVMQNVMTNLESGGQISEESQGAQGMYDQQQMLQSRMA